MLFRKLFLVPIALFLACGLSGCGKKEQESEEAASETAVKPMPNLEEMVLIPAGEATIGTNNKESIAYPERKVNIPAFWIDKYEVTNYQYLEFAIKAKYAGEGAKEGKDWRVLATPDKALVPVQMMTFNDAEAYCKAYGKRLPTEEEWEKAARGPNAYAYPWGNEWIDNRSNTAESGPLKPVEVGEYEDVTAYGAYDMLGNVREWTSSWYSPYPGNPKKDSFSGKQRRVVRGLSPNHRGKVAQLWSRDAYPPEYLGDVGFRCAKDAAPGEAAK